MKTSIICPPPSKSKQQFKITFFFFLLLSQYILSLYTKYKLRRVRQLFGSLFSFVVLTNKDIFSCGMSGDTNNFYVQITYFLPPPPLNTKSSTLRSGWKWGKKKFLNNRQVDNYKRIYSLTVRQKLCVYVCCLFVSFYKEGFRKITGSMIQQI